MKYTIAILAIGLTSQRGQFRASEAGYPSHSRCFDNGEENGDGSGHCSHG